jgi:predicted AlkP superfamily pyrophosphatase or phosphodiesterase
VHTVEGFRCRSSLLLSAAGLAMLAGLATASTTKAPPAPAYAYHPQVVIISIDGLRADVLSATRTPNIALLAARGSSAAKAETVTPSETLPGHASMLSGVLPTVHKMTWDDNEYRPDKGNITVPTLLSVARDAALQAVIVIGKEKLLHLVPTGGICVRSDRGDDDVVNEAIVRALLPFDVLFVHLPSVDLTGHGKAWMSNDYLAQVSATDGAVGRLLSVLPANATVILTADHGGSGTNHGENRPENLRIPWIIAGPSIFPGKILTTAVSTTDTAVTAAAILGLRLPDSVTGKVVTEAIGPLVLRLPSIVPSPGYDEAEY